MARKFQVFQHRQLCARNGDMVAGGGEVVAAEHPAVLELADPHAVGRFFDDEPAQPEPAATEPEDETREAPAPRRFQRFTKGDSSE